MQSLGRRRCRRVPANWPIALVVGDRRGTATVVDLSRMGARLRLPGEIAAGMPLTLICERLGALDARLVWQNGGEAGVEFVGTTPEEAAKLRSFVGDLERAESRRPVEPAQFGRRMGQPTH